MSGDGDKPGITIYMKEWCPYCQAARALLSEKGARFNEIEVGFDQALREEMRERSNGGTTVPQIFFGDRHIGGYDDLAALERDGQLDALLEQF